MIPDTMLAFQITGSSEEGQENQQKGQISKVPVPRPGPNQALIRVLRAGICNTDLEILKGYMSFSGTLGHEFVGQVVDFHGETVSEETRQLYWNKRVVGDINLACSSCPVCRLHSDRSRNHCPNRTVLGILNQNGTFAEYLVLPVANLHIVPEGIPNNIAVFCEPLAAACRIVEQNLWQKAKDRIVILGDGKLGLMIALVIGSRQQELSIQEANDEDNTYCKPILVGKHAHKLDLVKDASVEVMLLEDVIVTPTKDGENYVIRTEWQHAFDLVIDATGSPLGLSMALTLCRPMGTCVLKSTCAAGIQSFQAAPVVIDELHIVGSRCGPFPPALQLLQQPTIAQILEKFITQSLPLEKVQEAISCAAQKSTLKVQLICTQGA